MLFLKRMDERITLQDKNGSIELPLINILRIALVKLQPMIMKYLEETPEPTVRGLLEWLAEKLEMKGKNILI